ncbi:MAG: helix-hairpin-helix domain-containing protein [Ruminococcus sp.]|nr:MAG: helix-hairpin-helix domain-containing protein [Ruminococcus sp.]
MIAQRRAYIPEIEVIDAEEETAEIVKAEVTAAAVTYTESISTAEASALSEAGSEVNIVNINTASAEELMSLNGIGEKTAEAIIEYRKSTPFEKPEEIMNVKGIGEKKYENIKKTAYVFNTFAQLNYFFRSCLIVQMYKPQKALDKRRKSMVL